MIQVCIFLCALLGATVGAPVYGNDGGYLGYATYDPSRGQQGKSDGTSTTAGIHDKSINLEDSGDHDYGINLDDSGEHPYGVNLDDSGDPHYGGRQGAEPVTVGNPSSFLYDDGENLHISPDTLGSYVGHDNSDDYLSKASRTNSVPLEDNYVYPHQKSQYGHQGGYKISDVLPRAKQNAYSDDYPHDLQPYEYGYETKDEHGNFQSRKESSDGHKVKGSYGYVDDHGHFRQVDYVADKSGFRAKVKTNEPGMENQNPADVLIDSKHATHKH